MSGDHDQVGGHSSRNVANSIHERLQCLRLPHSVPVPVNLSDCALYKICSQNSLGAHCSSIRITACSYSLCVHIIHNYIIIYTYIYIYIYVYT